MNVRNCRKCGRIFNYVAGPPICPNCKKEMEDKFQEVKKYVSEHPGANIHVVAEECEVEVSQIQQWVREERLEFATDSDIGIQCEKCGAMIRSGRFCEKCKNDMARGFNSAIGADKKPAAPVQKKPEKENPRMRFLNN